MLTLYDFLDSGNGYKVRLALRELGRAYVYREMNMLRGETREAWFLAKNPAGEIPVLELEDGTCLCESTAILFHLAEGTRLLPTEPLLRTRVLQWMCFEQTHVDGVISRARFRLLYPDAVPTRPEELEAWWSEGKRALAVLAQQLGHGDYLVGDAFSIADICLFAWFIGHPRADSTCSPIPPFPPGAVASRLAPPSSGSTNCRASFRKSLRAHFFRGHL